jgi:hypothetical protein
MRKKKKLMREMSKCPILSAESFKHQGSTCFKVEHDERKMILKECSHQQKCKAS